VRDWYAKNLIFRLEQINQKRAKQPLDKGEHDDADENNENRSAVVPIQDETERNARGGRVFAVGGDHQEDGKPNRERPEQGGGQRRNHRDVLPTSALRNTMTEDARDNADDVPADKIARPGDAPLGHGEGDEDTRAKRPYDRAVVLGIQHEQYDEHGDSRQQALQHVSRFVSSEFLVEEMHRHVSRARCHRVMRKRGDKPPAELTATPCSRIMVGVYACFFNLSPGVNRAEEATPAGICAAEAVASR